MKATLWLWSLVTVLLVCVSQRVSAGPYTDTRIIQPQDNSLVAPAKRTKPSLSIVNPLDVLRQRIILEMARRQMRENTRQVERNKAILREIGKRSHSAAAQFRSSSADDDSVELGSPALMQVDRMYPVYPQPPARAAAVESYLRLFSGDYDMEQDSSREQQRKSSGSSTNSNPNNPESGKRENEQISSGPLTLAKEQHRLEQEQEAAEKAAAMLGGHPQELRFANDRLMLGSRSGSSFLDDPRDEADEDSEEYPLSNNGEDLIKQQRQQNQKLKNDPEAVGYRLRYLNNNNIQAKMYG